ncbi:MAG: hypothetical protein AVDCRST_MAG15-2714, partial [uncultured Rubellimicrobium sp.]
GPPLRPQPPVLHPALAPGPDRGGLPRLGGRGGREPGGRVGHDLRRRGPLLRLALLPQLQPPQPGRSQAM